MIPKADTVRTERLLLRPLRPDDAEALFALIANWNVVRWLSSPPWPYTIEDARSFIAAQLGPPLGNTTLAITLDGAPIGCIDVTVNKPHKRSRPDLGYWLGQPYWGRGYVTEAARGLLEHVFRSMAGDTIYSGAFADNTASLRVQEKLGFERTGEGTLYCRPRGEERAHVDTELTRAAFLARCG